MPDDAAAGELFVVAARRSGVRRFVFSPVIHPVPGWLADHAGK